ncbi:hypothetical protein GIB67_025871 [Kingdonia uniflora]|uniref:Uncharacterized protein n=1 Tax=Kingdonia uniflora TaxID=39325 RepID=A0A7J7MD71_9MAGN|nr:hypothetical protein GIB67_025871 [Kingdonia uniflora]
MFLLIAACKRKREKAVNNEVIDYNAITGQKPRIKIHPKYARPVGRWSSQFVRKIGLVTRQHGPLTGHDWSKVGNDVRGPLRDRVIDKFDIDMHLPHEKYVADKILGEHIRGFWCVFNSHYKKFENDGVARRYPYGGLAQEKWDAYCDWFGREEFKNISDQNSSNRQKLPTNHCGGSKPFVKYFEESVACLRDSATCWNDRIISTECNNLKDELEVEGAMPKTEDEILNKRRKCNRGETKRNFKEERSRKLKKRNEELKAEMVSQRKK